jgi:hypothetical protein
MSNVFTRNTDPQTLRDMQSDAQRVGKLDEFNAAVASAGLQVAAPVDQDLIRLYQRAGVEMNPSPQDYYVEWKSPDKVTPAEHGATTQVLARTKLPPGLATSLVSRIEELHSEVAGLSAKDKSERQLRAVQMVGGDAVHAELVGKARGVLASGGDGFKLKDVAEGLIQLDPWSLTVLGRFADAKTALETKLANRTAK